MSNTTEINPYIATLNIIQDNISRYGYLIIFIKGNIGCILNILIFTQRNYRQRSCSCYILASTLMSLLVINFICFFRILTTFGIDSTKTSSFFCKFRMYTVQATAALSRIFIVFACIDRWAMTSRIVQRRAFTQMKIPKILIPSVIVLWCLMTIHVPFYQDIIDGQCVTTSNSYLMFYNIYNIIFSGILIPIFMIVFSILTIRNVRQLQKRVHLCTRISNVASIMEQRPCQNIVNKKNYDYQLFYMIFIQQCVYIITTLPFASYLFYIAITSNWTKSSIQMSTDNFYMTVVYALLYLNFSSTFYIYTLTSNTFRKDLKQLLFHNCLMNMFLGNRPNLHIRPLHQNPI